ncbi:MAG TPA: hypothetical protein PKV22_07390, partial [Paludibacteraceae bacterium]|nr:hypothetical protein [Paludibacteraceae bacterium]
ISGALSCLLTVNPSFYNFWSVSSKNVSFSFPASLMVFDYLSIIKYVVNFTTLSQLSQPELRRDFSHISPSI